MKVFRILFRDIRDAFKSVFRNFSLSIASISCITITLLVVAIAFILSENVNNFANIVEKDVTIVAFIDGDAKQDDLEQIKNKINELDNIEEVKFESRTEIMNDMKASSEVFNNIMENYTEDDTPVQDTYLVKVKDIEKIGDTANQIKEIELVSSVKYGEGMVDQLISVFDVVRKISIIVVAALILVTAFLIANTIKITIFSRKREISIMRLVGASNINIKIPFIFEGLFIGLLGSIIPVLATIFGYVNLYKHFDGQLFSPFIRLITPEPFIYQVSLLLVIIGMVVGMFGSVRAVKRHLKI